MNKKWNEKNTAEKTLNIISTVAFAIWLLFRVLGRTTSVPYTEIVSGIALCVVCVCEAVIYWKIKRFISYIAIAGLALMAVALVLERMLIS